MAIEFLFQSSVLYNFLLIFRAVEINDEIKKSRDVKEFLKNLTKYWRIHIKIVPLYTKMYKLFTEIFFVLIKEVIQLIERPKEKFETLRQIEESYKLIENEFIIYSAFKDIHEEHKRNFENLLQEAKTQTRDTYFLLAISNFKELKLSETPMAISEKISLVFASLLEVSNFIIIEDINPILDAYVENAKARMNSCKKAYASLQKINITEGEQLANLDPKIFLVRLEAEAAFINKYLSGLKDLKLKKIQEYNSSYYFLD
jgi:hypothetical protein